MEKIPIARHVVRTLQEWLADFRAEVLRIHFAMAPLMFGCGGRKISKRVRHVFCVEIFLGFNNLSVTDHEKEMVVVVVMFAIDQVGIGFDFHSYPLSFRGYAFYGH